MRALKFWIIGLLFLLTGCASQQNQGEELALLIRGGYLASQSIEMGCIVTADYGERVYDFSFDSITEGETTTLTLTEPSELAGLIATIENQSGESKLSYEGVLVDTGTLSDDGLTPVTAVPAILEGLTAGYIQTILLGEDQLVLTCGDPDVPTGTGREIILTLDAVTGDLQRGEIFVDGFRVIDCEITNMTWGGLTAPD